MKHTIVNTHIDYICVLFIYKSYDLKIEEFESTVLKILATCTGYENQQQDAKLLKRHQPLQFIINANSFWPGQSTYLNPTHHLQTVKVYC